MHRLTSSSPPTLLAIDTAADVCSVALAHCGEIVESAEVVGHRHSERVLPMVEALLAAQSVKLGDCDAIAFGAGPGAFTGLRIACGIAQGLAYGARKPVIAIGNLEALALAALESNAAATRIFAANDARMREAYYAVYDIEDGQLNERAAPALAAADDLATLIARWSPSVVAGDAVVAFAAELARLDARIARASVRAGASKVAALAVRRWHQGKAIDPALAAPMYVRDRVALTIEERHAKAVA